jgi:hypothetical protein
MRGAPGFHARRVPVDAQHRLRELAPARYVAVAVAAAPLGRRHAGESASSSHSSFMDNLGVSVAIAGDAERRTETAKFTDSDETVGFGNALRRKRRSRERRVPRRSSSRRLTQTTMVSRTPDDNCPEAVNPDQADLYGDGVGDACSERERQTVRMS